MGSGNGIACTAGRVRGHYQELLRRRCARAHAIPSSIDRAAPVEQAAAVASSPRVRRAGASQRSRNSCPAGDQRAPWPLAAPPSRIRKQSLAHSESQRLPESRATRATRRDQPGSRACRRLQRRPQGTRVRHPSGPRPRRRSPSLGKEGPATLSALPSGSRLDGATITQYVLGRVTLCSDGFAEAIHQFSESLALWRETGDARTAPAALAGLSRSRRALAQDPGEGVYTLILQHTYRCM